EGGGYALHRAGEVGAVRGLRAAVQPAARAGDGLLAAALSTGIGAETQRPLAVVVIGGLVSATVLTLLVLPVMYAMFLPEEAAEAARQSKLVSLLRAGRPRPVVRAARVATSTQVAPGDAASPHPGGAAHDVQGGETR